MAFLKVESLFKNFGKTEVLKGISFEVEKNEVVAIIGSSGSGKTTLLRCLNFLETPESGRIFLGNELLSDAYGKKINQEEIRKKRLHFGLVFQSFNLFPQMSVKENISLAVKMQNKVKIKKNKIVQLSEIDSLAMDLLTKVGLTEKANSYPCELSGGQQQRVAIARALALSPDILCFDEPTSALDPALTGEVLKVIKELKNSNMTMIIVTHEMEFARSVADKIIFMADGVIECEAKADEFFENNTNEKVNAFLHNPFND